MRSLLTLVAAFTSSVLLLACVPQQTAETAESKAVMISIDGMPDWIFDKLVAEGTMPNVAAMLKGGSAATRAYTAFPSLTAPSHALLFTGTDPSRTGVLANRTLPFDKKDYALTESINGFSADALMAEPFWTTFANNGLSTVSIHAFHTAPFHHYISDKARFPTELEYFYPFNAYEGWLAVETVVNIEVSDLLAPDQWTNLPASFASARACVLTLNGTEFHALVYDDPDFGDTGFDSLRLCASANFTDLVSEVRVSAPSVEHTDGFSAEIKRTAEDGTGYVLRPRLFRMDPASGAFLLYHPATARYRNPHADIEEALFGATGGPAGIGAFSLYNDGAFGPRLMDGGNGFAEACLVETVRKASEAFIETHLWAMENCHWDLFYGYSSLLDSLHHSLYGYIAPPSGDMESEIAQKLWPYMLEVYGIIDDYIGSLYNYAPEGTVFFVLSDHGFRALHRRFYPNAVLREAGLMKTGTESNIDLTQTKAFYHQANGNFIVLNEAAFDEGETRGTVIAAVIDAISAAVDDNGLNIVTNTYVLPESGELDMTGPYAPDIYFEVADGYWNNADPTAEMTFSDMKEPYGSHYGHPRNGSLHSFFFASRKGSAINCILGEVAGNRIIPTICAYFGIPAPKDATGEPLTELVDALQ